jgi:hypothetical protein
MRSKGVSDFVKRSALRRRSLLPKPLSIGNDTRFCLVKIPLTTSSIRGKPDVAMTNPDETNATLSATPAAAPKPASIHDTFFHKIFSNPELAAAELKNIMPADVAAQFDWDSLRVEPNRFVDANLGNHIADILLSAQVRNKKTHIHLLFEHSSGPKTNELLQALRYQVRIWENEKPPIRDDGQRRLTPILTVILHHSETGWKGRFRFADYFGLDDDLARVFAPYLVNFGVIVDDISKLDTEALVSRPVPPEVHVVLFALRFGRTGRRILDELPKIASTIGILLQGDYGKLVINLLFVYMINVAKVSEAEIRMALQDTIEPVYDPDMAAVWEQYEAGERQGELKGELKGEIKGQRKVLKRLLGQRFGVLDPQAIARIDGASVSDLEGMELRVLTAATLEEALGKPDSNAS